MARHTGSKKTARRTNRYITYNGRTMIVADWAREIGASRQTIRHRLEAGWEIKDIINQPINYANRYNSKGKIIRPSKAICSKKSR